MPIQDLMMLLILLIALVLLGGIMGAFMPVSKYYYLCSLLVIVALQMVLKYFGSKKHPAFIASFVSYHFLQARRVSMDQNHVYNGSTTRSETFYQRAF